MKQYKKIGEICTVISGTTPKSNKTEYWNGNRVWITPAEISEDSVFISDSERHITDIATKESSIKSFPKGTVILSSRAPIGKVAIAGCEMYCNQGFKNLICSDAIYNGYLYFYLKAKKDYLNALGRGATFKEISKKIVENIEVPLPEIPEQKRIAAILFKIDTIIQRRNGQLQKLDELVKSRFIEMFGDPKKNPNGWHKCFLRDVMKVPASNGFFAKPEDYTINGNAGIICVGDVVNRKYSNVKQLRRANADEKQFLKYKVKYGDILFCRSSLVKAGIAKASILPKQTPEDLLFECHVIRVQLDMNIIIPEYMQAFTETDYFRNQMIGKSKTATMTTIGQKDVISGEILLPPIELQKNFEKFTEQVDKSKIAIQKSLDGLETLKKSLMQQYFG